MKKSLLSFVLELSILSLFAQVIPNGGFETTSYWKGVNNTIVSNIPVVTSGGKATLYPVEGSKFLLIENSSTLGIGYVFNNFAFSGRPDTFSFHLGYLQGNLAERMGVAVTLSKWDADSNKSDIICQFSIMAPGSDGRIEPWQVINIPMDSFYRSTEIPDSAFILFQNDIINNGTLTTIMVVDEARFSRQAPSGKTWVGILDHTLILNNIFYSSNNLYINYSSKQNLTNALVTIINMNGQIVYTANLNLKSVVSSEILNLPSLNKGIYILNILSTNGSVSGKFIIQ